MSNSQLEDREERQFAERVATALDLSLAQLDELEWSIDENVGNDGTLYGYTVTIGEGSAPEIVRLLGDRLNGQSVQLGPVL